MTYRHRLAIDPEHRRSRCRTCSSSRSAESGTPAARGGGHPHPTRPPGSAAAPRTQRHGELKGETEQRRFRHSVPSASGTRQIATRARRISAPRAGSHLANRAAHGPACQAVRTRATRHPADRRQIALQTLARSASTGRPRSPAPAAIKPACDRRPGRSVDVADRMPPPDGLTKKKGRVEAYATASVQVRRLGLPLAPRAAAPPASRSR